MALEYRADLARSRCYWLHRLHREIASGTSIPVLHPIGLLDFAHGGLTPDGLASLSYRYAILPEIEKALR
jgi:hypothetical protein